MAHTRRRGYPTAATPEQVDLKYGKRGNAPSPRKGSRGHAQRGNNPGPKARRRP